MLLQPRMNVCVVLRLFLIVKPPSMTYPQAEDLVQFTRVHSSSPSPRGFGKSSMKMSPRGFGKSSMKMWPLVVLPWTQVDTELHVSSISMRPELNTENSSQPLNHLFTLVLSGQVTLLTQDCDPGAPFCRHVAVVCVVT